MKTYRVLYEETLLHEFYIEAEGLVEAKEEFRRMHRDGELDFSDGTVSTSEIYDVEECWED